MRYKASLVLFIISWIVCWNWREGKTTAQDHINTTDYTTNIPNEQCITLKVGMTNAEIVEIDALYPYLEEISVSTDYLAGFPLPKEKGYSVLLRDNTNFIFVLDEEERLYRIKTATSHFRLNTGMGIGSTFAEVKDAYPVYTIIPIHGFGSLVNVGKGIAFGFLATSRKQTFEGIVYDTEEVSWIEFQEIVIPLTMIRHERGPIAKGTHASMDRRHKVTQLSNAIHDKLLICFKTPDCHITDVRAVVEGALTDIKDPELLAELAVRARNMFDDSDDLEYFNFSPEFFREEKYHIYRFCIEKLAENPEQENYRALKSVQKQVDLGEGERAFLEKLIQRIEKRLEKTGDR